MGQTKRKASNVLLDDLPVQSQSSRSVLRDVAVAIDPPPEGAVGIRELLDRLDFLVEADFFYQRKEHLIPGTRHLIYPRLGIYTTLLTLKLLPDL